MSASKSMLIALAITIAVSVWSARHPQADTAVELMSPAASAPMVADYSTNHTEAQTLANTHDWQLIRPLESAPTINLFADAAANPAPVRPVIQAATRTSLRTTTSITPNIVIADLPFRYFGQYHDHGETTLFLNLDGADIALKPGQIIADYYRLENINQQTAIFTYLPSNQPLTLALGE